MRPADPNKGDPTFRVGLRPQVHMPRVPHPWISNSSHRLHRLESEEPRWERMYFERPLRSDVPEWGK